MKAIGCEDGEKKSVFLKLIMEAPEGETGRGGVRDNVIESRFMSCEIERVPPPLTYITHLILSNGRCLGRSLLKLIHVRQVI